MIDIFSPAVPIPKYYYKLLASGDRQIEHSRRFLDNIQGQEITSKQNCKDVPANATISAGVVENRLAVTAPMVLTTMLTGKM